MFEYVDRTILEDLEKHSDGFGLDNVKKITWQLCRAIEFCHAHNVIHRCVFFWTASLDCTMIYLSIYTCPSLHTVILFSWILFFFSTFFWKHVFLKMIVFGLHHEIYLYIHRQILPMFLLYLNGYSFFFFIYIKPQ